MASTIQLKRRIKTAQNISKTTRALNLIATSKLKRGQDAVTSSRPYADKLLEVTQLIAKNVEQGDKTGYFASNKSGKDLYVVISPDKGLCGGMITNIVREYVKQTKSIQADVITVGKKIEPYVVRSKKQILASFPIGNTIPSFSAVYPIVELIEQNFFDGKVDNVYVIYTKFANVFTQTPNVMKILPVDMQQDETTAQKEKAVQLFEPSAEEILPALLRRYLQMTMYHYFLENYASFQAAQMTAMKNATDNAKDIIEDLKLVYNKSRQEKITGELLDISSSSMATS